MLWSEACVHSTLFLKLLRLLLWLLGALGSTVLLLLWLVFQPTEFSYLLCYLREPSVMLELALTAVASLDLDDF